MNKQNTFEQQIQSNTGCAVIFAGSNSDQEHIHKLTAALDLYGVPHQVRIASAHKQPHKVMEALQSYDSIPGALAYICVAGGTDALSGTVSFHTHRPVISCPPDGPNQSCWQNPPGSSNAYIVHPSNVGKFIAQLWSCINANYKETLQQVNTEKVKKLEAADGISLTGKSN